MSSLNAFAAQTMTHSGVYRLGHICLHRQLLLAVGQLQF